MFTTICAYLFIGFFFVCIEGRLRHGQQAKSWQLSQCDKGSQAIIGIGLGITSIMVLIAPVLNHLQIGHIHPDLLIGVLGLIIMIGGLGLRYWAAKTLGEFYTRTLLIKAQHRLVEQGPYRMIRHPGYLGVILLFIGAGIATNDWIPMVVIPIVLFAAYIYRIWAEEKMLQTALGEPYTNYMRRSWRLIPYIY
jgi:protein-S-isoprenylcysteine O-methyltransferase Ste14